MKRKGILKHGARVGDCSEGTKQSAKSPGGYWVNKQPYFNYFPLTDAAPYGPVGFSINGGMRAPSSYIGRSSAMSRTYTPFHGAFAKGNGGTNGTYHRGDEVMTMTAARVIVEGEQYKYIKPSTVSNQTMLVTKYYPYYRASYPFRWVQPTYPTGTQDQNTSQGVYTHSKRIQCNNKDDINQEIRYVEDCRDTCQKKTTYTASHVLRNGQYGYTKSTHNPLDSSVHLDRLQRKCQMPKGLQKPFPFHLNGGAGSSRAKCDSDNCGVFPVAQVWYKTPPDWYLST